MTVLVTGGAGFIGSHLVERLLARGDRVVVLDELNDYYSPEVKRRNLEAARASPSFAFVQGDIRDGAVLEALRREHAFDAIVHLAARAGVRPSLENPLLYEEVNGYGTLNVLEMARRAKVRRFVFASSSSVYGRGARPPFREDAPAGAPLSPYAATKAAGELYCSNYHALYGLSCAVLRFFTVYGARQRPDMAIHKFTRLIDRGQPVPFYGDGASERDYTYYTDIVDGLVASLDGALDFEIINLGESRTTSLARLVGLIEDNLGRKAILHRLPEQPGDMPVTCADVSKARRLLGYSPRTPIEEGVARFVEWYRAQG